MLKKNYLNSITAQYYFGLLWQIAKLQLLFLLLLTGFRTLLLLKFSPPNASYALDELLAAYVMGLRVDLVLASYLMVLPVLIIMLNHLLRIRFPLHWLRRLMAFYFSSVYLIVSLIIAIDIGYFSFFGEHIKLLIFGFFDDDTKALLQIGLKNYNVPLILAFFVLFSSTVIWSVNKIFSNTHPLKITLRPLWIPPIYLLLIILVFLGARGSFGTFPLIKDIPDVSADVFINSLPKNGVFCLYNAYQQYVKDKKGDYDLIKRSGYLNRVDQAFRDYLGKEDIDTNNLVRNLVRTTPENPRVQKKSPNVVLVMVESFGAPILKYQGQQFDIMRRLKKHFDQDIVFTNFLSGSNGTITSLEPLLLNLIARPQSIPYGQSRYLDVEFPQAAARVYQHAGYETSFVYGGDLSWRNVGSFFRRQGFDHVEGKNNVEAVIPDAEEHDWGVYDKHAYDFVLQKLKKSKKPQFVFLLTTNNHPPYTLSKHYHPKPLVFSDRLTRHITGNLELAHQRFQDYQYALDMLGRFIDQIKSGPLASNTVIAATGDNNTVEGIMHYDDNIQQRKRVPFYLYLPPYLRKMPFDTDVSASHNDIFPTLYNITLSGASYIALGSDLFDMNSLHCGYNDAGIVAAPDGTFRLGKAKTPLQKICEKRYRASLAVTETIVKMAAKHQIAKILDTNH